jgi:hypothetical protein
MLMGNSKIPLILLVSALMCGCGSTSNSVGGSTGPTRAINANTTFIQNITTTFQSTTSVCAQVSRNTSSCQSARTTLGLTGNWLNFSCNVVLGLADGSGNATTNIGSAVYVTLVNEDLPDYTSNYYPTTGSYSFSANGYTVAGTFASLYVAFAPAFPDPNIIATRNGTMKVPINPAQAAAESQTMGMGTVGMAINGVFIYDSVAGNTDNIFAESGSFDQCGGHPDPSSVYHYHGEPRSISYNDNNLIGVMLDGFFVYGRNNYDGSTPGSTASILTAGNASNIYIYGGDVGADPVLGTGNSFHYHTTEWVGCYQETGGVKSPNDGETQDTFNTPSGGACGGTWVDTWFLTGHGNGGVFATLPGGLSGESPSQTITATRYYYGTPGTCSNCP